MKKTLSLLICCGLCVACGGGSGVESDKALSSLNADERIKVCEYFVSELPPVGQYDCVEGQGEIRTEDLQVSSCIASDIFDEDEDLCTVGVLEACLGEVGSANSVCVINTTEECRIFQQFCAEGRDELPRQRGGGRDNSEPNDD